MYPSWSFKRTRRRFKVITSRFQHTSKRIIWVSLKKFVILFLVCLNIVALCIPIRSPRLTQDAWRCPQNASKTHPYITFNFNLKILLYFLVCIKLYNLMYTPWGTQTSPIPSKVAPWRAQDTIDLHTIYTQTKKWTCVYDASHLRLQADGQPSCPLL